MKKILAWALFIVPIMLAVILPVDAVKTWSNFLVAGIIPGTKVSLNFWSSLLLILIVMLVIRVIINNLRIQMMKSKSEIISTHHKKIIENSKNVDKLSFDKKRRSVVAPDFY